MDFGEVLFYLKQGFFAATRYNWTENAFIYYVPPGAYSPCTKIAKTLVNEDGLVNYGGYIAVKTHGGVVIPWTPTQEDILSEDWTIIPYSS